MKFNAALVMAGVISLVLIPSASAAPGTLTIRNSATGAVIDSSNPFSTCPIPITPQYVSVFLQNTGPSSDTYSLRLKSLPAGWTGGIQNELPLAAGEERMASFFLINMPSPSSLLPGRYLVVIEAVSQLSGHVTESILPIDILPCYTVAISAVTAQQQLCEESAGSVPYTVEIANNGKFTEVYNLLPSVSWATLSASQVSVSPGEKKSVTVTLTPPASVKGVQTVDILAKSATSYASGKATLQLDVRDCYRFTASLQPSTADVCLGAALQYTLEIDTQGQADTYALQIPPTLSGPATVSGQPGKTQVTITAKPTVVGSQQVSLTVTSQNDPSSSSTLSASLRTDECRGIVVVLSSADQTVCAGDSVEYVVTMKNTGTVDEVFNLSATKGTLAATSVALKAGETKATKLTVSGKLADEEIISVIAAAPGISDSASAILRSETCYDAALWLTPAQVDACPCSEASYLLTLENRGKRDDTYTLSYLNASETVALQPGAQKTVPLTVGIGCGQTSSSSITARAVSPKADVSASAALDVKNQSACFGVKVSNGKTTTVDIFEGAAIPVTVRNTGESIQEFTLSVKGPSWLFITPTAITLTEGQSGTVFLYASPPFGTVEGIYTARVTSTSRFAEDNHDITISVGAGGQVIATSPDPSQGGNATVSTSSPQGIILNVTIVNTTGEVTRADVPATSAVKTIAIGIITVIIIIVLVIRFAILMKK